MSLALLFTIFVLLGVVFQFLATFPRPPYSSRIAWGCWLIAAIIWAFERGGLHA